MKSGSLAPAKADNDKVANKAITANFKVLINISHSYLNSTANFANKYKWQLDLNQKISPPQNH